MKQLTIFALLFLMAAGTASSRALGNDTNSEEDMMDFDKVVLTMEELAGRPMYEGSYEQTNVETDAQGEDWSEETGNLDVIGDESEGSERRVKRYVNNFDQLVYFVCPIHETISRITSYHSNHHEDRRYSLSCKPTFQSSAQCVQSGWVNNFDERIYYTCPRNYAMAGMVSYHSNHHEDRRFLFRCCTAPGFRVSSCHWTPYVNNFDEFFSYSAPNHFYLTGVQSYHDNHREDRRFKFYVCS